MEQRIEAPEANHVLVKSDRKILELALQDLGIILAVIFGMVGTGALRAAKYLNEAYREFLQKMRIVEDMPRLWENAPETEVRGCHIAARDVSSSSYTSCISCKISFDNLDGCRNTSERCTASVKK